MKNVLMVMAMMACTDVGAQKLADVAQYVPAAAAVGLEYVGPTARHPLRERILMTATAYTALTATVGSLKLTVSERRPDGSDHRSFPSGHAARAFMGAELVRTEYGWSWGLGAYAMAAAVGIQRVAGDHHFLHDVAAGALIGVASARVACWLLPLERRLLGWDSPSVTVTAIPAYAPDTHTVGVAVAVTLH